jgi:hypothetical protein
VEEKFTCKVHSTVRRAYPSSAILRPIAPTLVALVAAWLIGVELSTIRATAAPVGRFPLLAIVVYVADEHPAFEATAGTLQAGVVSLNGVVIMVMVMVVIVVMGEYPICVHSP